jgi:hypothetical protein
MVVRPAALGRDAERVVAAVSAGLRVVQVPWARPDPGGRGAHSVPRRGPVGRGPPGRRRVAGGLHDVRAPGRAAPSIVVGIARIEARSTRLRLVAGTTQQWGRDVVVRTVLNAVAGALGVPARVFTLWQVVGGAL